MAGVLIKNPNGSGRVMVYLDGLKVCGGCKRDLPLDSFYPRRDRGPNSLTSRCMECCNSSLKTWRDLNLDKFPQIWRNAYSRNAETKKKCVRNYRKNNHDKCSYLSSVKRSNKLQATVPWSNSIAIREFYTCSSNLTEYTGVIHHVDHVVPLKSPYVCGFHCEINLNIIPAEDNMKKHNQWWPQMFEITPELKAMAKAFKESEKGIHV